MFEREAVFYFRRPCISCARVIAKLSRHLKDMSHGGQPCHNHDCSEHECGSAFSLYKQIDLTHVSVLFLDVSA